MMEPAASPAPRPRRHVQLLLTLLYLGAAAVSVALVPAFFPRLDSEGLLQLYSVFIMLAFTGLGLISPARRFRGLLAAVGVLLVLGLIAIVGIGFVLKGKGLPTGTPELNRLETLVDLIGASGWAVVCWTAKQTVIRLGRIRREAGSIGKVLRQQRMALVLMITLTLALLLVPLAFAMGEDDFLRFAILACLLFAAMFGILYPGKRTTLSMAAGLLALSLVAFLLLAAYLVFVFSDLLVNAHWYALPMTLGYLTGMGMFFGSVMWQLKRGIMGVPRLVVFIRYKMTPKRWLLAFGMLVLAALVGWRGYVTYRIVAFKVEYSWERYPGMYVLPEAHEIPNDLPKVQSSSHISWRMITFDAPWPGAHVVKENSGSVGIEFANGKRIAIMESLGCQPGARDDSWLKESGFPLVNLFQGLDSNYAFDLATLNSSPADVGIFTPSWTFFREYALADWKFWATDPSSEDSRTYKFATPYVRAFQFTSGRFPSSTGLEVYGSSGQYFYEIAIGRPDRQSEVDYILSSMRIVETGPGGKED